MATKLISSSTTSRQPRSLWRNLDYVLLFSGQTISGFGSEASQLAFPLLILALTHSPIQAGIISGLRLVPYIVLGLPAGAWVDRVDRKRLMIGCDIIRALALGSIPLAYSIGHLTSLQLYVTSLIEGSLYVFFTVAETSCLPHVIDKEQMSVALGQDQASDGAAKTLGPSIGGVLFSLNQLLPFMADTISYVISVISLCFIRVSFQNEKQPVAQRKLLAEVIEGLSWLWHQPLLRFVAGLNCGFTLARAGIPLLIITLMQQQNTSSASIGLVVAIGGVGLMVGSFLGPLIQKRFSYKLITIMIAWAYLLFWSLYLLTFDPLLLGVITAAIYMLVPIQVVANSTCRLLLVPDEMRGRINSVMQLIAWCAFPLGTLAVGTLLQLVGPTTTVLLFAAVYLVLAALASSNIHVRRAPSWAELQRIHDIANAAHAIHSQISIEDISPKNAWVSFDRYLIKLPDQDTDVQEVYAFPSVSSLAQYRSRETWIGIERYLLKLPDRYKDTQNVEAFISTSTASEPLSKETWTGIERYLLKLPDRYKDTQNVEASPTLPGLVLSPW
jgi:MFS family permease